MFLGEVRFLDGTPCAGAPKVIPNDVIRSDESYQKTTRDSLETGSLRVRIVVFVVLSQDHTPRV